MVCTYSHTHNALLMPVVSNFSRQECWSGLAASPPGDPAYISGTPALVGRLFSTGAPGEPVCIRRAHLSPAIDRQHLYSSRSDAVLS